MSYKVQFLNDEEFDKLPAVNIQQKVGVAYPDSGEAYVRRTGSNVLDVFTALHELEHLEGDSLGEHFDAENKCYYKDFGQTLMSVAPIAAMFIPGIGPALGGALSGLGSGVAGALGSIPGIGGALGGAASSIGGGIGSALGIGGGAGGTMSRGASSLGMQGPAANAGRMGAGQMLGGQAAYQATPNVLRTGASAGLGSALGKFGQQAAGSVASNAATGLAQNMFGGQDGPMQQFGMDPGQGSYNPQTQSQPNQIAGSSGPGSAGGPGGAPGSVGGGAVSKLKQYLQQSGSEGQGAASAFGGR